MVEKYIDYSGADLLWKKINKLVDKKLDNVENYDDSIRVENNNKIAVNISTSETNVLSLVPDEGLYVSKNHTLTFGSDKQYVYDGTRDITVPVYNGTYTEH